MRLVYLLAVLYIIRWCDGIAVMSIDLGTEWMKVAIVSPSKPIEIVLNKESKRRTPLILGFDTKNNERLFGDDAEVFWKKNPQHCLKYFPLLLGKPFDHPIVKWYQNQFPFYKLVADPKRGTVLVKISDHLTFSVEELVGQFLSYAKQMAEISANQTIQNAVLIVPGFYNQAERLSILQAAQLANLKVLQLINDYSALAINYAVFNLNNIKNSSSYNMYLDFGSSKTMISIIENKLVGNKFDSHPRITVKGIGYDLMLNGLENQLLLRNYLAIKFNEMKKTKNDVFENSRAMAKLFSEAGRVKKILSINQETNSKVENLMDDIDFSLNIKKKDFDNMMGKNLCDRIREPIEQALKMSELSDLKQIDQFTVFGGNSRVPKIEDCLQKILPIPISKNFDRDEAATIGAAIRAADLSVGFKVKKFVLKDAALFPIAIEFDKMNTNCNEITTDVSKKILYSLLNPVPQKKVITFNRQQNFNFKIYYDDLDHLNDQQIKDLGELNLAVVSLNNVSDVNRDNLSTQKGVKIHFVLNDSGVLNLSHAEYVYDRKVDNSQGIFNKLSGLFGDNKDNDTKPENVTMPATNDTIENDKSMNNTSQIVTESIPINFTEEFLALHLSTDEDQESSLRKLAELDASDALKKRKHFAQNNLESFVFEVQLNLDNDDFVACIEPNSMQKIRNEMNSLKDWLEEYGYDDSVAVDVFEKKLSDFKLLIDPISERFYEHLHRPELLKKLEIKLKNATTFISYLRNFSKEVNEEVFSEKEIENFEKLIDETNDWKKRMKDRQRVLKKYDNIELTLDSIRLEMMKIDNEVRYLLNKKTWWKPTRKNDVPNLSEKENSSKTIDSENNTIIDDEIDQNSKKSASHSEL